MVYMQSPLCCSVFLGSTHKSFQIQTMPVIIIIYYSGDTYPVSFVNSEQLPNTVRSPIVNTEMRYTAFYNALG